MLTKYPIFRKDGQMVFFELTREGTSLEIDSLDTVDILQEGQYTFALLRGIDGSIRCIIYNIDILDYDMFLEARKAESTVGDNFLDVPAYILAGYFFAEYTLHRIEEM